MNLAKRLYELQYLDSEIHNRQGKVAEINDLLGNDESVQKAKTELIDAKNYLSDREKTHRDLEWEVEDLRNKISKVNDKLYGGKVNNPKELLSLKQEAESFKTKLDQKEDDLLDVMADEETAQKRIAMETDHVKELEEAWQKEQDVLYREKTDLENQMGELNKKREVLKSDIESPALGVYEGLRSRRGQAVVKVEQGRCQGCRITLSTSEQQRARSGALVQCGSCGMILYL